MSTISLGISIPNFFNQVVAELADPLASTIKSAVTLLKRPLDQIMKELPLDSQIKDALLGRESSFKGTLDLTLAMEQAKWEVIRRQGIKYGLSNKKLFEIYTSSLKWADQVWMETIT